MTDNAQILATRSRELLDNPAFKAAIEAVRSYYMAEMVNTKIGDVERRDHMHRCIHALYDVQTTLTGYVETGILEKEMAAKVERAKK